MGLISLLILFLSSVAIAKTEEWRASIQDNGLRKVSVSATGMTPDGATWTTLTLQCQPGPGGLISFLYTVSAADQIKQFPWQDFEGPDAPASGKKLGRIQVFSKKGTVTIQKALAGYFANPQAFAFSFSIPSGQKSDGTEVIDKLIEGAGTLSFCVEDGSAAQKKICTDFIARDAGDPVAQTMKPCYKN